MSKDIIPYEKMSVSEILEVIGQGTIVAESFPQLRINRLADNIDGDILPIGTYFVYFNGENVYGKTVLFRPFLSKYQYRIFDTKEEKYKNRSIQFNNWNEDIYDEQGTFKCGKVSGKAKAALTPDQQEQNKSIRCSRIFYGTVSFVGVTAKGEKVTVQDFPCMWRVQGNSFLPVDEIIKSLTKRQMLMYNHFLLLNTKREQTGSNVYYVVAPALDKKTINFTEENFELIKTFQNIIDSENSEILDKWRVATSKQPSELEKKIVGEVIDVELNDEIPF